MFEEEKEEDFRKFARFMDDWKTGNYQPLHMSKYCHTPGVKTDFPDCATLLQAFSLRSCGCDLGQKQIYMEQISIEQQVDTWAARHRGHSSSGSEERLFATKQWL